MTTELTHGVITDGKLMYSITHTSGRMQLFTVPLDQINGIVDILHVAFTHNLHTVWVCPGDIINHFTANHAVDPSGIWDIKATTTRSPLRGAADVLRGVTARRKEGTFREKRQIVIVFPQWTPYQWDAAELAECTDPISCLAAIHYLERALGMQLHHNPGIAGRDLIASTNETHSRPQWVRAPSFDFSKLSPSVGFDLAYNRGVDPLDVQPGLYMHAWDKNSMYLAAASSANLGSGEPVYLNPDELIINYDAIMGKWYDAKRPGYWRVAYDPMSLPAFNPLYKDQEWVTTPLLKLLYAMGADIRVKEAYVWTEHHRILDKFSDILWDARQSLKNDTTKYPHAGGRAIAYYSIKRIATAGVGMLANKDASKYSPQWFRPDWRATIVEEAKARIVYKLLQVEREYGTRPLAVATDAVYYLSTNSNPNAAFMNMFNHENGLGGWKVLYSMPATAGVLACFKFGVSAGSAARGVRKIARQTLQNGELL